MAKQIAKTLSCALVAVFISFAAQAQVTVEPHWTPYNPPTSYADGTNVYIIQKGDTLWDLAQKFLNDPYLWPQIWKANDYISDPHWIYPGDPLVIGEVAVAPKPEVAETPATEPTPEAEMAAFPEEPEPAPVTQPEPEPAPVVNPKAKVRSLAYEADIACAPFVFETTNAEAEFPSMGQVVGGEEPIVEYSTDDVLYLNGGTATGLVAGQEYLLVRKLRVVKDPAGEGILGIGFRRVGRIKILLCHENSATAVVTFACQNVNRGDLIVSNELEPIPLTIDYKPVARYGEPVTGDRRVVVLVPDAETNLAEDSTAVINAGSADGLIPGDIFVLYQEGPSAEFPVYLGEAAVLFTGEHTATVRVIHSVKEIMWDRVFGVKRPEA